jgi:hypothetical protein
MFPPCSMPSFSMTYSLSWRIWGDKAPWLILTDLPPEARDAAW